MLHHLEFYWIPPQGSLRYCERITVNSTSIDQAIARAEDVLENQTFPLGKANLCLIKDQSGLLLREIWAPVPPVTRLRRKKRTAA